jgi:hypothetical protein
LRATLVALHFVGWGLIVSLRRIFTYEFGGDAI